MIKGEPRGGPLASGVGVQGKDGAFCLLCLECFPLLLSTDRRHAMRGRLYYTAKAKKTGKVMIKTHPCSRLCFCKCWTCFKEVTDKAVGNTGGRVESYASGWSLA